MIIQTPTQAATFEGWQSHALAQLSALAEKLLGELEDIVTSAATNEQLNFAQKLTILASYIGHGKPMQAFPFFNQAEFARWLSGESEPSEAKQGILIQLCLGEMTSVSQQGTSLNRVLSYLESGSKLLAMLDRATDPKNSALILG